MMSPIFLKAPSRLTTIYRTVYSTVMAAMLVVIQLERTQGFIFLFFIANCDFLLKGNVFTDLLLLHSPGAGGERSNQRVCAVIPGHQSYCQAAGICVRYSQRVSLRSTTAGQHWEPFIIFHIMWQYLFDYMAPLSNRCTRRWRPRCRYISKNNYDYWTVVYSGKYSSKEEKDETHHTPHPLILLF